MLRPRRADELGARIGESGDDFGDLGDLAPA